MASNSPCAAKITLTSAAEIPAASRNRRTVPQAMIGSLSKGTERSQVSAYWSSPVPTLVMRP